MNEGKSLSTTGCYPKYSLVVQTIIDRSFYTALTTVPKSRQHMLISAITDITAMEPSVEVIDIIEKSTAVNDNRQEDEIDYGDDSGDLFLQVFVGSIIKLTNLVYKMSFPTEKTSLGRTVFSLCEAISEYDLSITSDYSNYDENGEERLNIASEGWISCALVCISNSPAIREMNARIEMNDLEFSDDLRKYLLS